MRKKQPNSMSSWQKSFFSRLSSVVPTSITTNQQNFITTVNILIKIRLHNQNFDIEQFLKAKQNVSQHHTYEELKWL